MTNSEVNELTRATGGTWVVPWVMTTQGTTHIRDLDAMSYTRCPGPSSRSGGMLFDGEGMPITRVQNWPKVGFSFLVWFDDPEDPEALEHYRASSTVVSIKRQPVL